MHYKLKHEQYEENLKKRREEEGKAEEKQENLTAFKRFT